MILFIAMVMVAGIHITMAQVVFPAGLLVQPSA